MVKTASARGSRERDDPQKNSDRTVNLSSTRIGNPVDHTMTRAVQSSSVAWEKEQHKYEKPETGILIAILSNILIKVSNPVGLISK
jgi:hypothetical protein